MIITFWYKHISIEVIENNRGALRISALSIAKKKPIGVLKILYLYMIDS
jgi:hypothetical protein